MLIAYFDLQVIIPVASKKAQSDSQEFVELQSKDLLRGALDWAMAQVTETPVYFSSNGSCWLEGKPNQAYSPSTRYRQSGILLDVHDVQLSTDKGTGQRIATVDGTSSSGPDTLVAMCRAIVTAKIGLTVMIPAKLAIKSTENTEEVGQQ